MGLPETAPRRGLPVSHTTTRRNDVTGRSLTSSGTKINGSNPALFAVCTAYPAKPLHAWPVLFHPPVELPSFDQVAVSTWIGGSTSRRSDFGKLLHIVVAQLHS